MQHTTLNPDKSLPVDIRQRPFVRLAKDMRSVQIFVPGFGPIYVRKIGKNQDPSVIEEQVKRHARNFYRFHWVQ